jgi:nicotinic acid mononucleotide adenylyltransferase
MPLPTRWDARYAAAAARLMNIEDVLAVRTMLESARLEEHQTLRWLGDPPATRTAARVGVLTGSFNPLTPAHPALMRSASRALRLNVGLWALSHVTVDKEQVERATLADRVLQMQAFLQAGRAVTGLLVLGAGLYADQATALRAILPAGDRVWLIIGYDKVMQIFDPKYYADRDAALQQLFAAADVAVAPRGAHTAADLDALLTLPENRPYARQVRLLPASPELANYSSTAVRVLAAQGATAAALAGHVEPEGAALALATHAFSETTVLRSGEVIDPYALRQALITRLAERPRQLRADLLAAQFERACAPTAAGARLRDALRLGVESRQRV